MGTATTDQSVTAAVLGLVGAERDVTLAVNGPDGWPMAYATTYENRGLDLYFLSSDPSLTEALKADPRIGAAIHRRLGGQEDVVSVSMRGRVQVADLTRHGDWLRRPSGPRRSLAGSDHLTPEILLVFRPEAVVARTAARGVGQGATLPVSLRDRVPLTRSRP